jgi:hypothetical protein
MQVLRLTGTFSPVDLSLVELCFISPDEDFFSLSLLFSSSNALGTGMGYSY